MEKARRERVRVAARKIEFKRLESTLSLKPESKRRMTHCAILQAAINVSVSILISYMSILICVIAQSRCMGYGYTCTYCLVWRSRPFNGPPEK